MFWTHALAELVSFGLIFPAAGLVARFSSQVTLSLQCCILITPCNIPIVIAFATSHDAAKPSSMFVKFL
jgi:hypothetical protein